MANLKKIHRKLLEATRRLRRSIEFGVDLPRDHIARLVRFRPAPIWREVKSPPSNTVFSRWYRPARMLIESQSAMVTVAPASIQPGNPGVFPNGVTITSEPALVYWIPSAIYHGYHGAITDSQGTIFPESVDHNLTHLDLTKAKGRSMRFKGRAMVLSWSKNYYHWLTKILPRLDLIERAEGSLDRIETFLIDNPSWRQQHVYERLGIWSRCVVVDSKSFASCRMLVAATIAHDCPDWACRYLNRVFNPGPLSNPAPSRMIYVARGETAHRAIINESEVCAMLQGYGFEIVHCGALDVQDQASLFADSRIIVSPHGAALSNLVFCRPGTTVLEIFGTPENQKMYWLVSHRRNLRYQYLMAESIPSSLHPNMRDMRIDLRTLARNVEQLLEDIAVVPPQ